MERVRIKQPRPERAQKRKPSPRVMPTEAAKARRKQRGRAEPNHKRLTKDNVLVLRARPQQYMVWDSGTEAARGLSILVSPAGAKSYRSTYYFPGSSKPHSRHLGRVGEMELDEARRLCRLDRGNARNGIDPKADDPTRSISYEAAVEDYVTREEIGRKNNSASTADEAKRMLLKLSHPTQRGADADKTKHPWLPRPVASIRPQEIQRELELIRDGIRHPDDPTKYLVEPHPYIANALFGRLRSFFAWCGRPTIAKVKTSPMVGIEKPWSGAKPRDRDWFKKAAGDNAIKMLWGAAGKLGVAEGSYLKVMLLIAKRKTALARMLWQEIDADWFWNAPQPIAKNKRLHGVPLPMLARRILSPRKSEGFVFPGNDGGHISVDGGLLQAKILRASGLDDFFLHGIRHLAETKMAELKIAPHIRDLLLDHVPARGSGKGYDHHDYKDEMLVALEIWAANIESLVQPDAGVTVLR